MPAADWQPHASNISLKKRAELFGTIRSYFKDQKVMEVETPMLSASATVDIYIDSFSCDFISMDGHKKQTYYLHTSPEFAMKKLLSSGSGDIYSLGRVFRNGEIGSRHNPEFTMLEWYRLAMNQQQLMDDVGSLLSSVSSFKEIKRYSYRKLFYQHFSINPHLVSDDDLSRLVHQKIDPELTDIDRNDCLDLLFSHVIAPKLSSENACILSGFFVYDYPVTMSAGAQIRQNENGEEVASRFELFVNGLELANGYHELLDAEEQLERFQAEQRKRKDKGYPIYPFDHRLVDALSHGLPDCSGVALGIDRLLMLMMKTDHIADVLAFPFERA